MYKNQYLDIEALFSGNKDNINWRYTGPFDKTKQIVRMDNLLHLAARTGDIDKFLSIYKKSIEKDISLLEYNDNHENPFHIAARMRILPKVVRGMFEYLQSEVKSAKASVLEAKEAGRNPREELEKLESLRRKVKRKVNSIKDELYDKTSADNNGYRPVDWVSDHVERDIRKEVLRAEKSIKAQTYSAGAYEQDEVEIPDHILYDVDVDGGEQCRIL
jgi:succinylglutamate desuccinylase